MSSNLPRFCGAKVKIFSKFLKIKFEGILGGFVLRFFGINMDRHRLLAMGAMSTYNRHFLIDYTDNMFKIFLAKKEYKRRQISSFIISYLPFSPPSPFSLYTFLNS